MSSFDLMLVSQNMSGRLINPVSHMRSRVEFMPQSKLEDVVFPHHWIYLLQIHHILSSPKHNPPDGSRRKQPYTQYRLNKTTTADPKLCCWTQLCPTLCDPMDCNMPGFLVFHHLLELAQTHSLTQWCHSTVSSSVIPFSFCLQSFPAAGSFPMSCLFASGSLSTGVSASASVLPMNTQDWSPLGWTGWISLQSKGLSRVFSNTTVQKHQFFGTQPSLWSNSYLHTRLLEKP